MPFRLIVTAMSFVLVAMFSTTSYLPAMTGLFEEIIRMPTGALKGVVKLRGKVITLLGSEKKKAAG